MATDYSIVAQYETVEFLGGTQTRPVMAIGVRTNEHGIYFEFRVPKANYTAKVVAGGAHALTITYESIFDYAGVTDVEWTQEPTNAGQLEDHVIVYVTSTSGNSASSINLSYAQLTTEVLTAKIRAIRSELNAAEGL